jgi:hypothetical protein
MTKLLEKAFKKASQIPEIEQNTLAKWLMDELEADRRWEQMFAESEDILDVLADEALDDFNKGKTKILDLKEL